MPWAGSRFVVVVVVVVVVANYKIITIIHRVGHRVHVRMCVCVYDVLLKFYHIITIILSQAVGWEEGLKSTAEWYRSHKDHWPNVEQALLPHPLANPALVHVQGY